MFTFDGKHQLTFWYKSCTQVSMNPRIILDKILLFEWNSIINFLCIPKFLLLHLKSNYTDIEMLSKWVCVLIRSFKFQIVVVDWNMLTWHTMQHSLTSYNLSKYNTECSICFLNFVRNFKNFQQVSSTSIYFMKSEDVSIDNNGYEKLKDKNHYWFHTIGIDFRILCFLCTISLR